ncbi:MAG: low affinity iron permease family protein, partial [Actinomycetota bacterium]
MPTEEKRGFFDRFAERASEFVSRAPFFAFCLGLVVIWLPTYPLVGNFDTWQLLINTPTTILTFLLVAILQNSQRRAEIAIQEKLNAMADGLADLMDHFVHADLEDAEKLKDLKGDVKELRESIGLEQRI